MYVLILSRPSSPPVYIAEIFNIADLRQVEISTRTKSYRFGLKCNRSDLTPVAYAINFDSGEAAIVAALSQMPPDATVRAIGRALNILKRITKEG